MKKLCNINLMKDPNVRMAIILDISVISVRIFNILGLKFAILACLACYLHLEYFNYSLYQIPCFVCKVDV